jgi:tape measure domain-containing protein
MSDILASVSVVLGAEVSGFKAAMADARRELKGLVQFSEGLKDIGTSLSTYVSLPLAALGTAAVAASAKMESLKKGVEAITAADLGKQGITGLAGLQLAAQQAGDRLKVLEVIAKAPGIGFEQAVAGDIRLRAVGITAEQSAKSLKEFANAIATTGGGASEFDRVTTQLAQLSAKGRVLSQDLRPIIEAAPAVSQALLKLYGTIDSESISASLTKQGKSSQDFIAVLTEELSKLPRVTGGLANAFENLQQTAVQSAAKLGDGISKALNIPALVEGLSSGIERLGNAFGNLAPGTQKLIVGLGVLAAATGPVLVAVGTLGAALPALTAGFATLGITSAAALGPIGIGIAAVAVGAALIVDNWSELTAYFTSGEGGRVFSDLASSITNSVSQITDAFSALNGGGNFGDLVSATGIFKAIFRDIATGITAVSNVFGGAIGAIVKLLSGDLTGAAAQGQRALLGLVQPLANVLGFQLRLSEATQGVKEKFDALAVATPGLAAVLNNLAGATPFPVANIAAATRTLGLLEQLKARLKEVQEQRDKETTVGAIKVDNAEIISLQKQIAALEGTTKKGTDAVAKLRQELARLTALDNILGNTPSEVQVLERRVNTLTSGLQKLVDAGISTSSRAFRGFAADLVNTSQALDRLRGAGGSIDFKPVDVKSLIPRTIGDTLPADVARLLGDYAKQVKPFELPVPVKLNMQAILDAPKPLDFLNGALLNIGKGFREISAAADIFGGSFDAAAARIDVTRQALQDLVSQGLTVAVPQVKALSDDLKNQVALYDINRAATDALTSGLAGLANGLLEGLGQLATGTITLEGFGATVLGLVGKLATQLGEAIIAVGIGMLNLKAAFTNPFAAIAAGAALVVVGTALGAISSSLGSVGSSSGGGGGAGSSPTTSNYGQNTSQTTVKVTGEFLLRGKNLVAAVRGDDYRSSTTG